MIFKGSNVQIFKFQLFIVITFAGIIQLTNDPIPSACCTVLIERIQ
jgi:hypothetical protein